MYSFRNICGIVDGSNQVIVNTVLPQSQRHQDDRDLVVRRNQLRSQPVDVEPPATSAPPPGISGPVSALGFPHISASPWLENWSVFFQIYNVD